MQLHFDSRINILGGLHFLNRIICVIRLSWTELFAVDCLCSLGGLLEILWFILEEVFLN